MPAFRPCVMRTVWGLNGVIKWIDARDTEGFCALWGVNVPIGAHRTIEVPPVVVKLFLRIVEDR